MKPQIYRTLAVLLITLTASYSHAQYEEDPYDWEDPMEPSPLLRADISLQGWVTGCNLCTVMGTGEGVYDNLNNELTFTLSETIHIDFSDGGPIYEAEVDRNVFFDLNAPSGTQTSTACTQTLPSQEEASPICNSSFNTVASDLGAVFQSPDDTSGTIPFSLVFGESVFFSFTESIAFQWTVTISDGPLPEPPSEVPAPAAIWLFGSGVFGFASLAYRRRRSQ